MNEEPTQPNPNAESIRFAKRRPAENRRSTADNLTNAERRVHQLQVHETELEMQNGELRLAPNLMEAGLECRATLTDITQSRLDERDRSLQDKLEAAGSLAAGLAQDYGDLLAKILQNLELAQTLTPPNEAFLARHIEAAAQATVVAQELTQHMSALSSKTTVPVKTPVALPEVLQACSKSILDGHPVQCLFLIPKNLWKVVVDLSHLGQVLHHVILNAREAMPHGGTMTIQAENHTLHAIEIDALPPGDYVRLSISDRGCGMPEAIQPKIFDPYFTTKVRESHWGRGLGLTICKSVIRKNGGTIEVESHEGVGTTFHIDLPALRHHAMPGSALPRPRLGNSLDEPPGLPSAPLQVPSPT